jgi:hypothetical protein
LGCDGGYKTEASDGNKDCAQKARYIGKHKSDGVVHYLLLLFRDFLRAKVLVDTELDRLLRLTRAANVCHRGYYEDRADHASQNIEHRH